VTSSGWFSERSVAYLATGRPVIVQETGFTSWLSSSGGVTAFRTADEALEGIRDVTAHYDHHCRDARNVAERYFDARQVLSELIDRVTSTSESAAARNRT